MNRVNNRTRTMESGGIDLGPVSLRFYWEEPFKEVGHSLTKWLNLQNRDNDANSGDIKNTRSQIYFIISNSAFKSVTSDDSPRKVIRSRVWDVILTAEHEGDLTCICRPRFTFKKRLVKTLPQLMVRWANPLFSSYWELQAGYLLYDVVLKILHRILLRHRITFAHAAGLSNSLGDAVLISGAGGIGKTTTSAYLMSTASWQLIADDFLLVSEEGMIYDSRLPAHIYGYHTPLLEKMGVEDTFFSGWLDRMHWIVMAAIKKEGGVRRITLPNKASQAKVKVCVVVDVVDNKSEEVVKNISPEEAAYAIAKYTHSELSNSNEEGRLEKEISILSRALSDTTCYRVEIGEDAKGHGLAKLIMRIISKRM